jgi:pyridoxal phosphate enzyme (YggS family)
MIEVEGRRKVMHPDGSKQRRIEHNWAAVCRQVAEACERVGRDPESVCLIGVSKYVDAPITEWLVRAGCENLGESRPQILWQKAEAMSIQPRRWHMIGHVQTNKLRRMLRHDPLIHSVDSERLLRAIDQEMAHQDRNGDVLLEVNISEDESKTGLSADAVDRLLQIDDLDNVRIVGLMAMAGWGTSVAEAESQFRAVADLRADLESRTGKTLPELSMGMSGDYPAAIAAGATMVRIGSALFEGVR